MSYKVSHLKEGIINMALVTLRSASNGSAACI
jgi:hypothetical protein